MIHQPPSAAAGVETQFLHVGVFRIVQRPSFGPNLSNSRALASKADLGLLTVIARDPEAVERALTS
jgi:hypothetical protein